MSQVVTTNRPARPADSWVQRHIRISSRLHSRIRAEDKLQFFQQLTTLFAAGTPLLEALRITAKQSQSEKMQAVIRTIGDRVAGGVSLHNAAADFPKIFERQWIEIIRTGELSGRLGEVLGTLTSHIGAAREMHSKLISSMIYPCILLAVAVLAIVVMLWKVVPTFADFFTEFGSTLPAVTQVVIDTSNFLVSNGLLLLGGVVVIVVGVRSYLRSDRGRRTLNQLMLTAPVIGNCVVQTYMVKFATNISLLLRSGLPLLDAIVSLQGVFHHSTVYRQALQKVEQQVAGGEALATALAETGLFTSLIVSMVRVGEESGQLAHVLEKVGLYYRKRVETLVQRLSSTVEPVVILVMGLVIAVILASIYLPMFQMASGPR